MLSISEGVFAGKDRSYSYTPKKNRVYLLRSLVFMWRYPITGRAVYRQPLIGGAFEDRRFVLPRRRCDLDQQVV
jgi:hypothetical protein